MPRRGDLRLDGHIGVYAQPGAVEVQAKELTSWGDVDEFIRQLRRAARKSLGEHPSAHCAELIVRAQQRMWQRPEAHELWRDSA